MVAFGENKETTMTEETKSATHYTHWFLPMTGSTAEKHGAFPTSKADGYLICELIANGLDGKGLQTPGLRTAEIEAAEYQRLKSPNRFRNGNHTSDA